LHESGVLIAIRDINDFFFSVTGGSYLKNTQSRIVTAEVFRRGVPKVAQKRQTNNG
jgi:hypothetical protein